MSSFWNRLSARERRLAAAALTVIVAAVCIGVTAKAVARLRALDETISQLEFNLKNCASLDARRASVEKEFSGVAAQHSSSLTKAEIHNSLRNEIYRLARENPDAPATPDAKNLVEIPRLRQGTLKDSGEGYREYQLSIKVPVTDVYSLMMFLMRLLASEQTLRIDGLEMDRSPQAQIMSATVNVTRTVVDGAPEATDAAAASLQVAAWDGSDLQSWVTEDCGLSTVSQVGDLYPDGGACLEVAAKNEQAAVFMTHELEPGATYELSLEAIAGGPATVRVMSDGDGAPFDGEQALTDDGKPYRYRLLFTAPDADQAPVKVRAPCIVLAARDGRVFVDNVVLTKLTE